MSSLYGKTVKMWYFLYKLLIVYSPNYYYKLFSEVAIWRSSYTRYTFHNFSLGRFVWFLFTLSIVQTLVVFALLMEQTKLIRCISMKSMMHTATMVNWQSAYYAAYNIPIYTTVNLCYFFTVESFFSHHIDSQLAILLCKSI